jgi:hypothetical protein
MTTLEVNLTNVIESLTGDSVTLENTDNVISPDTGLPVRIKLFKPGHNPNTHGHSVVYDPENIHYYESKHTQKQYTVDIEHLSGQPNANPIYQKALAHFNLKFARDGVWAENIEWTNFGIEMMDDKGFKNFSPEFSVAKTGEETADGLEIVTLERVYKFAVTNTPAKIDPEPMAASARAKCPNWSPNQTRNESEYLSIDEPASAIVEAVQNKLIRMQQMQTNQVIKEADGEEQLAPDSVEGAPAMTLEAALAEIDRLKAENEMLKSTLTDAGVQLEEAQKELESAKKKELLLDIVKEGKMSHAAMRLIMKSTSLQDIKESIGDHKDEKGTVKINQKVSESNSIIDEFSEYNARMAELKSQIKF